MTGDEARAAIGRVLRTVAPEADLEGVGGDETLREALDLDSIDFLNFVVGLHQETGVEVPERDYGRVSTLAGCIAYLSAPPS